MTTIRQRNEDDRIAAEQAALANAPVAEEPVSTTPVDPPVVTEDTAPVDNS